MAVSVTTDLAAISLAESTTDGGTHYRLNGTSSANPAQDLDAYVQGGGCVACKMGAQTGAVDVGSHFNHTTTFDLTSKMLFFWRQIITPGNMLTKANQGITLGLTNTSTTSTTAWSTTNYKKWYMDGSDTMPIAQGWVPYTLDPTLAADASAGTLTLSSVKNVGFMCRQNTGITTTVSNQFVDAIRMGTGITATTSAGGDVLTFANIYAVDNTVSNRWGVITQSAGIYYGAGVVNVGATGQANVCNFADAGQVFVWRKNKVADTFYKLNLLSNSATNKTTFQLTSSVVRGQDGQKWNIACDTNSEFKAYSCSLADINTATLSAGSVIDGSSLSTCGQIDLNGGSLTATSFSNGTATSQVLCSTASEVANITDCTFTKGTATQHAIEIGGAAANFTLNGINFSGYAGSNGSTGNEAVFVNIASGNVEITVLNGSNPSIRTAGATVSFAATPVTVSVTVKDALTGDPIQNARVLLEKTSDGADILTGITNASGVLSGSYSYTADTPIVGAVRRATAAYGTRYKAATVSGTITDAGFSATVLLISDE